MFLLQDYAENGLYRERVTKVRNDGVGSVNWNRTLRHTNPVFDREPIYLRPVTVQNRQAFSGDITALHAHIVGLCARLLQPLMLFENLALPDGTAPLAVDTDCARFIPLLNEKMSRTFSERNLRLLKALRAWCGQTPYNQRRFGVTSFELLWQYAANLYFGNIADTRSDVPLYYKAAGSGTYDVYSGTGNAIPDTL